MSVFGAAGQPDMAPVVNERLGAQRDRGEAKGARATFAESQRTARSKEVLEISCTSLFSSSKSLPNQAPLKTRTDTAIILASHVHLAICLFISSNDLISCTLWGILVEEQPYEPSLPSPA